MLPIKAYLDNPGQRKPWGKENTSLASRDHWIRGDPTNTLPLLLATSNKAEKQAEGTRIRPDLKTHKSIPKSYQYQTEVLLQHGEFHFTCNHPDVLCLG